ncbi:LruC domain-containing protein [Ketobacter sp.]|uniref:LruC domain-containing protein n=1 Tax=Ketobacter sp. TaxID=2083498 RepID=UPI000F102389|nr:LruC domain-containing protein [Ketobacter sp.]RLT96785.1 MAG: LruC domain-containing protein [Ketobacter sp.]
MNKLCLLTTTLLLTAGSPGYAWQQQDNRYIWEFLTDAPWPTGYNQNTGKPDALAYHYADYPREFFARINNALPEARVNEAFMTDDAGSNITLKEEGEVFVTFIHEGAGYKNAFGYFTFDKNNPPTSAAQVRETIVFPNLSYPHLANGHRLSLGTFPAGTSIGFFIAANGFSYYTGVKDSAVPYYYSLKDLNPEQDPALKQHNVLLYDEEVQEVIIGFEDLPRTWGDNDFNDAVFSVRATPASALDTTTLGLVPAVNDSDADGIPDAADEFPNDFRRVSSSYYPSANSSNTLAFEDNWPEKGDYDLNDLVVSEQVRLVYDANNQTTGFILSGAIEARGAAFQNGFALRLLNVPASALQSATLTIAGEHYQKQAESGQTDLVFLLWQDTHRFTDTGGEGACSHFNTVKSCPQQDAVPFTLDVRFANPQDNLTHAHFDYFLFRTQFRGREIHFADYPPTDRFDLTQFGKFDDTSDPAQSRYFRSADNLPWAIQVAKPWRHPREYIDVLWAYPDYETWVESSGAQARDWHQTSDRIHHYY